MKKVIFLFLLSGFLLNIHAQKYMTRTGYIGFFSHTPLEDIKAENNQVASVLDASNGDIVFQVLMRSFHFDKALMEEHFNENYVESEKYPKATFAGNITDFSGVDLNKDGEYNVSVKGKLSIHGVTKEIEEKGVITVKDGKVNAHSEFEINPDDYSIEIPSVVREKIAKEISVTVDINYSASK